ncbi:MAG TPA: AI-2E family transporter [Vicinamibacterales bacterium]|nr:AI-2E family transporter [Vicinamibacterales bacterium]
MAELSKPLSSWITFAGCVLVIGVLYWAQAILVPVCLAVLLTFVLTPPVVWLQRRIGKIAAVLTITTLVFTFLGLAGWGVLRQMSSLSTDLPTYRANIRAKVHDLQGASNNGSLGKLEKAVKDLQGDVGGSAAVGTPAKPVVVTSDQGVGYSAIGWLGPLVEPAGTAGFVIALVMFMLLEREELRDRLIGLVGHGHLAITTKALDEAGSRVSRQLLLQSVVNLIYGALAALGLWLFGVPYPLFWGVAGAMLRFIPYLGPISAATGPILIAFAALPGWRHPLQVAGYYAALELFTNFVLESALYAGAAGVSQVGLMISVAFWTWLWGPLGLLMGTPLTVCLVVLGKHVAGLDFLAKLLSDVPALTPENSYYQRLLARDQAEAADIVERFVKSQPPEQVYDAMLIPALNYAERDRLEDRLSSEEEAAVIETTRELLDLLADAPLADDRPNPIAVPLRVLGYAANGAGDELALRMLSQVLAGMPIAFELVSSRVLASELVEHVRKNGCAVIVIADLPPSTTSRTRYLVKKLKIALPDVRLVVARWSHPTLADDTLQPLTDAGASHVASTLLDTRKYLAEAAHVGMAPVVDEPTVAVA